MVCHPPGLSFIRGFTVLLASPGLTGIAHLTFSKSGSHYTWRKVTTTVHNIIVGRLWVDNQGEMDITNHTTGDKCHLKYSAYSYFSREPPRKVLLKLMGGGSVHYTEQCEKNNIFQVFPVPVRTQ